VLIEPREPYVSSCLIDKERLKAQFEALAAKYLQRKVRYELRQCKTHRRNGSCASSKQRDEISWGEALPADLPQNRNRQVHGA